MNGGWVIVSSITEAQIKLSWRDAWKIAGKIAFEVQFRSAMSMSQGAATQTIERQIDKARSNTRFGKLTPSIFITMLAAIFGIVIFGTLSGLFGTAPEYRWVSVAFTISTFSLLGFAFLVFWGIMVSTSFISTNAAAIGHYLPLSQSDTGKLALLAYIRLFDAQMFAIVIAFPIAYFFATFSVTGTLACLGAFLISVGLAITVMLLLALYFYTRVQFSGGSKLGSIIRILFIIMWAMAILGLSLSLQLLNFIIPLLESLAITVAPYWHLLYFAYPFSLGTFVVLATGIPNTPPLWIDFGVVLIYGLLALFGVRWATRFLFRIGTGGIVQTASGIVRPASVKVSRLSVALFRKDIRIATRTPGQAIMFFLPILTMVPVFLQFIWNEGYIHVYNVVIFVAIPTIMLGFFSIFFLSVETRGMAYTMTLPLKTEKILRSKAQLITCMALAIPVFIIFISFFKPFTNSISFVIAISQIAVVYVSAYISLVLFTRIVGGGRLIGFEIGQHVTQMLIVGFLSVLLSIIPLGLFGLFWFIGATLTSIVQIAHFFGVAGLWVGIGLNYGVGKLLARALLIG